MAVGPGAGQGLGDAPGEVVQRDGQRDHFERDTDGGEGDEEEAEGLAGAECQGKGG